MTEALAIAVLSRERYRKAYCVPRYTPRGWFECDLLYWTRAGYATEFEVKLTLADFKADAAKVSGPDRRGFVQAKETKHQMLARGAPVGPSRFYFVTPSGLLPDGSVPSWAGHLELVKVRDRGPIPWQWMEVERKPAPKLHKVKLPEEVRTHALGVCYFRMHNLLVRLLSERV